MPDSSNIAESHSLEVTRAHQGVRLDKFLADSLDLSRAKLQALVKGGQVSVAGRAITKPRQALETGQLVVVSIPEDRPTELIAQDLNLDIIFEDNDLIVINKPIGLVVHPGAGNQEGTLVNGLLHHCETLSSIGDDERPGIVHRLDKETSGCMVAAKTNLAHESLVAQFSGRETSKAYHAVTAGIPSPAHGTIKNRLGRHPVNRQKMSVQEGDAGKEAITDYEIIASDDSANWAHLRCVIHTGRTHQIRVHLSQTLRCPILGDEIYATIARQKQKTGRMMLHARELGFRHPVSGERVRFESPLPPEFEAFGNTR